MNVLQYTKHSPTAHAWKAIGISPKHGICLPLFSIHTQQSCGIGEFLDLIPLISWCAKKGFRIIQLLPLNDTGEDTSPYNSISSIALNPLFLSLSSLPDIHKIPQAANKLREMQELSSAPSINYKPVKEKKWAFLKTYYQKCIKPSIEENHNFFQFLENEHYWLYPYATFRALKHHMHGAPINNWPKSLTDKENFPYLTKKFYHEVLFFSYLQFLCYKQLIQVKAYADQLHVLLKGDLPILISKDSCDVWYFREYFSSSRSVGAPPDLYNSEGQNWHLPIYNFSKLAQDDYIWWKERLKYSQNFYSLYRLDHIVGLFQLWIWDSLGNGKFVPENPKDYIKQGKNILSAMLTSSSMLPIGEDLGTIPADVKITLTQLGICGTRIPRWERNWQSNCEFIPLKDYSPLSVTTLSTHDSDTLGQWWVNSPKEARQFAKFLDIPFQQSLTPSIQKDILRISHQSGSIFHINLLNDYLALCPDLVSKNLKRERINTPGTVSKKNWSYRVLPPLNDLFSHKKFNLYIDEILSEL
ncbi:4-alpha-glucanotransferase,4-alpha-glucanotransferase,4-alpha-glucanotransferase,4-alpha-glucanotransferase [Chlamydia serpentis]|uniref:4-alpha-glucanotransferase n=1 Tax=Chlamydia serpentis TaxID=1967782 RepID=A0A2R8FAL1_9CHLA|nr:4-alpha-glucanotransferase [Chlamydia serpentis]SPN73470.1 4-alpha-glucanotransferase,4-alpha-glucanotransferase,4-alpha-glucanotransferase,4-alpha-glucanotransferase [Chlamydia serpentis]